MQQEVELVMELMGEGLALKVVELVVVLEQVVVVVVMLVIRRAAGLVVSRVLHLNLNYFCVYHHN